MAEVYQVFFWMRAWGHTTPKRTFCLSSASEIGQLDAGPMPRSKLYTGVETTKKYVSKEGKKRFCGSEQLKGTQLPDMVSESVPDLQI